MTDIIPSPSINPASRGNLSGTMRLVLSKFLNGVNDMLPARVLAYDPVTNLARVQPMVMIVTTEDQQIEQAQVASVQVMQLSGGGFIVRLPINEGDLGWIKSNDQDISIFKQSLAMSPPNTDRQHSFEDAVFIPDAMFKQVTIDPADTDKLVIQSLDGTTKIAMGNGTIEFVSDTLTHNGINIGDTHTHGGVMPGGGNTGVPNP